MKLDKHTVLLKMLPIFKHFPEEHILSLLNERHCYIKDYNKEEIVYFQNQKCKTFDVILEGKVLVQQIEEDGNVLTISEFFDGDTLGGNLLFADANDYPMTVVSKTFTRVLHIPKHMILDFCSTDLNFMYEYIRLISNRTLVLGNKFGSVTLKTIRELIIDFLLYEYQKQGECGIRMKMTKQEWAEKIGVQRPSLSRELLKMKKEGLIDYDLKRVYIKDIEGLARIKHKYI